MRATLKAVAPEVQSLLTSTPLRKRSKFYSSSIQTFLSRQQPHLCDLHRQQAQGGWSQIYLLGSSPSWSFQTPCSQNWAAPWRILCDPACQRGGHFIQLVLSCVSFISFDSSILWGILSTTSKAHYTVLYRSSIKQCNLTATDFEPGSQAKQRFLLFLYDAFL